METTSIIIICLLIWNTIAFLTMSLDKARAASGRGKERVSEKSLFTMALLFGSLGIFGGMYAFRHKTKKWYFQIGLPLIILLQLAAIYYLYFSLT